VLSPPITRSSIRIKEHRGEGHEALGSEGRPYTQEDVDAYKKAKTQLDLGDWMRSSEIASFFFKHGFALPDQKDSIVLDDALDYQDVKLKIVQQEGYDAHDFNLFDDRSSVLWRKPYIDGAVRELTRSRPPAATYISRARARHPGPLVSHARHVTAARSLLFRLPSLWFFQLRSVCTEFRTSGPQQSPKSAVRSAEFRTHGPHSTKIPHPFRTLFRILDGLLGAGARSGSLRSVVRAVCSREQAQEDTPAIPLLLPLIYSQQVRSSSTFVLIGLIVI